MYGFVRHSLVIAAAFCLGSIVAGNAFADAPKGPCVTAAVEAVRRRISFVTETIHPVIPERNTPRSLETFNHRRFKP